MKLTVCLPRLTPQITPASSPGLQSVLCGCGQSKMPDSSPVQSSWSRKYSPLSFVPNTDKLKARPPVNKIDIINPRHMRKRGNYSSLSVCLSVQAVATSFQVYTMNCRDL